MSDTGGLWTTPRNCQNWTKRGKCAGQRVGALVGGHCPGRSRRAKVQSLPREAVWETVRNRGQGAGPSGEAGTTPKVCRAKLRKGNPTAVEKRKERKRRVNNTHVQKKRDLLLSNKDIEGKLVRNLKEAKGTENL